MTKTASTSSLTEKQVASILAGMLGTLLKVTDQESVFNALDWLAANKDDIKKALTIANAGLAQSGLTDRLAADFHKQ